MVFFGTVVVVFMVVVVVFAFSEVFDALVEDVSFVGDFVIVTVVLDFLFLLVVVLSAVVVVVFVAVLEVVDSVEVVAEDVG